MSDLVKPFLRYAQSGEINTTVAKPEVVLEELKKRYSNGGISTLDGIRVDYPDFWFNVRKSNTEPLVRLTVEAKTEKMLQEKKKELVRLIEVYGK